MHTGARKTHGIKLLWGDRWCSEKAISGREAKQSKHLQKTDICDDQSKISMFMKMDCRNKRCSKDTGFAKERHSCQKP